MKKTEPNTILLGGLINMRVNNESLNTRKNLIDYRQFGEFCRTCRKRCRLTQVEVGEMLGYSGNHISEFERGNVDSLYLGYAYSVLFGATIFNYITWCSKNQFNVFTEDIKSCLSKAYPIWAKSYFTSDLSNIYGSVATATSSQYPTEVSLKEIFTQNEMDTHINIKKGLMQSEREKYTDTDSIKVKEESSNSELPTDDKQAK